jgi:glycerophosphoryl diester phosphodiesterase
LARFVTAPDSLSVAILGHRGASVARPENTIDAFLEAARQGADGVELDVRRGRDGALVVHHDAVLADGRAIADLDVADLPPAVPLLAAALEACADLAVVNVEIKNMPGDSDHDPDEYLAGAVAALIADAGLYDRVLVSCFSLATIDRVAELDGDIRRGYLTSPRWDQLHSLERAVERGHHAIHPHHVSVSHELVSAAHDAGLAVNTWTVDEPERIRWLAAAGVDAVITNVPDLAIAVLKER